MRNQFEIFEINLEGEKVMCTLDNWSFKCIGDDIVHAIGFTIDEIDFHGFIGENYIEFEDFVKNGRCYQSEFFKKKYSKMFESVIELIKIEIEMEENGNV